MYHQPVHYVSFWYLYGEATC